MLHSFKILKTNPFKEEKLYFKVNPEFVNIKNNFLFINSNKKNLINEDREFFFKFLSINDYEYLTLLEPRLNLNSNFIFCAYFSRVYLEVSYEIKSRL